ncbi:methylated-DNA--[protein]-cysteine S-methyltransferase [Streptomyces sp. 8K308]|uniref:methylated-DNA--[protein]-cysteine S-methyltransferase n=1 Tax=Streptomyces sp. 8K308 TaxID=2530388 RepID=UPI00104C399C|nr:methylated-DNA--[protein]-cysteine S-methyltransferase [Streptomyces sp. 8K308]TDC18885.1 methylated-DNA--[protein]-cysteine S-methyltransferase [Streptomyces sp. 8K308]
MSVVSFQPRTPGARPHHTVIPSPLGELLLSGDAEGTLSRIDLLADRRPDPASTAAPAAFREAADQLAAYFAGHRTGFALRIATAGTPFQLSVWQRLVTIPYGTTLSYGELASKLGRPTAARAVGAANGANPVPIIVPCHRVLAASGDLTGFGLGGLARKRLLLSLESGQRTAF